MLLRYLKNIYTELFKSSQILKVNYEVSVVVEIPRVSYIVRESKGFKYNVPICKLTNASEYSASDINVASNFRYVFTSNVIVDKVGVYDRIFHPFDILNTLITNEVHRDPTYSERIRNITNEYFKLYGFIPKTHIIKNIKRHSFIMKGKEVSLWE